MKAEEDKKLSADQPDPDYDPVSEAERAADAADAALDSFLGRKPSSAKAGPRRARRFNPALISLIAAIVAIASLIILIVILNSAPYPEGSDDPGYAEAKGTATVDEAGMHELIIDTDSKGEPVQNGSGTLLSYIPAQLKSVTVKNRNGEFTIQAHTNDGEATEYVLEGYEDFELRTGKPDDVANDACDLTFSTVAGTVMNISDFGLDRPRATADITFTDGTSARVRVGDNAPSSAGVYVAFGTNDTVYLVTSDAVDSFFYTPIDFISLTVTPGADTAGNAVFKTLTISGTRYPKQIVMKPNTDASVNYSYIVTSPRTMYAHPVTSSDIAGSIRDLYAEEIAAVNSEGKSSIAFLAPYGLGGDSYAEVLAEYPDCTIRLRSSKPDDKGYVYLINASDAENGSRVIYKIQAGALGWVTSSLEDLYPDTILSVSRTALSSITLTAGGKGRTIDVQTHTETVENTEGETEEVTVTEAYFNDKLLESEDFSTLFQNLTDLQNTGDYNGAAGDPLLEIRYTYSTGREPDVIVIYDSDSKLSPVYINGAKAGSVDKSDAADIIDIIEDIAEGRTAYVDTDATE